MLEAHIGTLHYPSANWAPKAPRVETTGVGERGGDFVFLFSIRLVGGASAIVSRSQRIPRRLAIVRAPMADAPVKQVVAAEGCTGATVTAANSQAAALGAAAASAIAAAFSANPSPLGTRHPAPGGAKVAGASRCAAVAVQPPAQPPPRPQPKLQPPTPLCAGVVEQAPPALQRAGAAPTQAPPAPLCVGAANPAPQCATAGYLPRCVPAQLAPQCMAAVPSMAFCPSQYPLQLGPGGYMGGAPGMGVPAGGVPRGGAMPLGHPCCGHPMAGGQVAGGQVAGGQGAAYPSAQYPVGMQIGVGQTGAGQAQGAATQAYTSPACGARL